MQFNENKRQWEHITPVLGALLLRWLEFKWALAFGLGGLLYGAFGSRLIMKNTHRPEDEAKGYSLGKITYGISIIILILLFYDKRYVAAGGWALLSLGDGFSTLAGKNYGKTKLPWNPDKSWAGSAAFVLFGGAGAFLVMAFVLGGQPELVLGYRELFWTAFSAAFLCAALESLPLKIDDNLTIPLIGGSFIYAVSILSLQNFSHAHGLAEGLLLSLALGTAAYFLKMVSASGFIGGAVIGTLIYLALGWQGFIILALFFVGGSLVTKFGYAKKNALGIAQEAGGRRGSKHAAAKCSAGLIMACLALFADAPLVFQAAFVASFATALFDTVSSEIGQLYGKTPILLTSLKIVPVGTEGAVSVEGTACGILASALMALAGMGVGLIPFEAVLVVMGAAFLANILESILGSTLEQAGKIGNEGINFLNTLAGAVFCMLLL